MENLLSYLQFTDRIVERLRELGYDNTDDFEDEVLAHHADYRDEHPSVYCGSYFKYASGSLAGYQKIDIIKSSRYKSLIYCISCDNILR